MSDPSRCRPQATTAITSIVYHNILLMLPNVLHNRRVSVLPPASRTPPAGRDGGLRAEDLPAQLVAAVVPQAAVGDQGRGGVAPAM